MPRSPRRCHRQSMAPTAPTEAEVFAVLLPAVAAWGPTKGQAPLPEPCRKSGLRTQTQPRISDPDDQLIDADDDSRCVAGTQDNWATTADGEPVRSICHPMPPSRADTEAAW
jgi:hypothetical protein